MGAGGRLSGSGRPAAQHFKCKVADVLSALHKRDDMRFKQAMDTARAEVMASLSAASWESYQRAYTYCLQLQCLQEIEHMNTDMGPIPLSLSSSIRSPQSSTAATLSTLHQHWTCRLNRTIPTLKVREPLLSVRRVLCEEYGEMAAVGLVVAGDGSAGTKGRSVRDRSRCITTCRGA